MASLTWRRPISSCALIAAPGTLISRPQTVACAHRHPLASTPRPARSAFLRLTTAHAHLRGLDVHRGLMWSPSHRRLSLSAALTFGAAHVWASLPPTWPARATWRSDRYHERNGGSRWRSDLRSRVSKVLISWSSRFFPSGRRSGILLRSSERPFCDPAVHPRPEPARSAYAVFLAILIERSHGGEVAL